MCSTSPCALADVVRCDRATAAMHAQFPPTNSKTSATASPVVCQAAPALVSVVVVARPPRDSCTARMNNALLSTLPPAIVAVNCTPAPSVYSVYCPGCPISVFQAPDV